MENKNMIIIAVAVIAIVAIVGVIFATGLFNGNDNKETTSFEMDFMAGNFTGNVSLENGTEKFMHSYEDKKHQITYNISTVDNSSALMEIYELQGVTNPEERSFNGNEWNIYFTQGVSGNDTNVTKNNTLNIIICQCQGEKQGYLIYAIFDPHSDVDASGKMFSPAYKEYIEPLLKSLTLKESSDVPAINDQYGLTADEFAQQIDLIRQYKAGNLSALDG